MSKSTRRTIADIEDDCGYDYGTPEFRNYVEQYGIDIIGDKKKLKAASKERRSRRGKHELDD